MVNEESATLVTRSHGNLPGMARSIEHRAGFCAAAKTVHDTVTDTPFIRARLQRFGGPTAELAQHTVEGSTTTIHTKHGIPADKLPGPVRTMLGGELTIERAEQWHQDAEGYTCEITVTVPNAPGKLTGTARLTGEGEASTQLMHGEINVHIPVVGSRVEESVSGHITALLDKEADFLNDWLRGCS